MAVVMGDKSNQVGLGTSGQSGKERDSAWSVVVGPKRRATRQQQQALKSNSAVVNGATSSEAVESQSPAEASQRHPGGVQEALQRP